MPVRVGDQAEELELIGGETAMEVVHLVDERCRLLQGTRDLFWIKGLPVIRRFSGEEQASYRTCVRLSRVIRTRFQDERGEHRGRPQRAAVPA
ncbi:MAG: hypothetical protein ACJ76P_02995 [Actinomycetota bacterium]